MPLERDDAVDIVRAEVNPINTALNDLRQNQTALDQRVTTMGQTVTGIDQRVTTIGTQLTDGLNNISNRFGQLEQRLQAPAQPAQQPAQQPVQQPVQPPRSEFQDSAFPDFLKDLARKYKKPQVGPNKWNNVSAGVGIVESGLTAGNIFLAPYSAGWASAGITAARMLAGRMSGEKAFEIWLSLHKKSGGTWGSLENALRTPSRHVADSFIKGMENELNKVLLDKNNLDGKTVEEEEKMLMASATANIFSQVIEGATGEDDEEWKEKTPFVKLVKDTGGVSSKIFRDLVEKRNRDRAYVNRLLSKVTNEVDRKEKSLWPRLAFGATLGSIPVAVLFAFATDLVAGKSGTSAALKSVVDAVSQALKPAFDGAVKTIESLVKSLSLVWDAAVRGYNIVVDAAKTRLGF